MKRRAVEKHLGMPFAEWRQKKRQEWAVVMRGLKVFEYGAAYTPAGNDLYELRRAADRIEEALREEWVSW